MHRCEAHIVAADHVFLRVGPVLLEFWTGFPCLLLLAARLVAGEVSLDATGRDGLTQTAPIQVGGFAWEAGELVIDDGLQGVAFPARPYVDPIVVAKPLSMGGRADNDPVLVRLDEINGTVSSTRAQEWDYSDDRHTPASVHYQVMESGRRVLPDGKTVEVGRIRPCGDVSIDSCMDPRIRAIGIFVAGTRAWDRCA